MCIITALLTLFFVGCGGAQKNTPETVEKATSSGGEPQWVGNPPKGCAAGSSKVRGIRSIASKAAVAHARDELTRQLKTVVQGMIKSYQRMGEADGKDFAEEDTTAVTRQIVDQTMVGTRKVREQKVGNEIFSLVCLDLETFANAFEKMNKADETMRKALKKRAEEEFKDLDAQIEKIKNR